MNDNTNMTNMDNFEHFFPYLVPTEEDKALLSKHIGRYVKYKVPTEKEELRKFVREHGAVAKVDTFQIIGIQLNYLGVPCFRCKNICINDRFGRCIHPGLVEFVEVAQ